MVVKHRDNEQSVHMLFMVRIIHFPMQDFQTIAHLIPNFGDRVEDPPAALQQQDEVRRIFREMLGQSAAYIQPVLFRSGRLVVYSEAAIWGQHIQHRHARILERCKDARLHVNSIEVKVRPGSTLARSDPPQRPASYDSEAASTQMEKLAAQVKEENLSYTLKRLARRIRENHEDEG